ncbi:MAG: hypothetical protein H6713_40625 [Myxococcales bacterium]|nr:hypothetical protein [Myxococcales bacterium]
MGIIRTSSLRIGLSSGRVRHERDGATGNVTVVGEPLEIDVPADILVAQVAGALLQHSHESITTGRDARSGGAKPPIKPRTRSRPGRRSQHRGYATGELADDLERQSVTGDTQRATTVIQHPDRGRAIFLASEAAKGVHHVSVEGKARQVIESTVNAFLEESAGTTTFVATVKKKRRRTKKRGTQRAVDVGGS